MNRKKNATLVRYFVSYMIVLIFLCAGSFFSMRIQLKNIYLNNQADQVAKRLDVVQESLEDGIASIARLHSLLKKNISLILWKNTDSAWYLYETGQQIAQFGKSNDYIDSVVILDRKNDAVLSSYRYVEYEDGQGKIYYTNPIVMNQLGYVSFTPGEHEKTGKAQLSFYQDGEMEYLLFFPEDSAKDDICIFYILDELELENTMKNSMVDGMLSVALLDADNRLVYGVNTEEMEPFLEDIPKENTVYSVGRGTFLCVNTDMYGEYSLVAVYTSDSALRQISEAVLRSFLLLLLLGTVGILIIGGSMQLTYVPLRKLAGKFVDTAAPGGSYIELLDHALTSALSEKEKLQERIEKYRLVMQKSLLDSVIEGEQTDGKAVNIDPFFEMEQDDSIFVLKFHSEKQLFPVKKIADYLEEALPGKDICVTMEKGEGYAVYLIRYVGMETDKEGIIEQMMEDIHKEYGICGAASVSGASPMEIPSLYENACAAAEFWESCPVVSYNKVKKQIEEKKTGGNGFQYPYSQLNELGKSLRNLNFPEAKEQILLTLDRINGLAGEASVFPEFFIRCVLIDILTTIVNAMNRMNIPFEAYSELYLETLFYCRSCSYQEKRQEIRRKTLELTDLYQAQMENTAIHKIQIEKILDENYCSPDFSIAALADHFHVSIAYMSYLFKKKFDENFSDYLWSMRFQKAKNLLLHTDMAIDQISMAVGYLNPSSFRRKFKQETDDTPSHFRKSGGGYRHEYSD